MMDFGIGKVSPADEGGAEELGLALRVMHTHGNDRLRVDSWAEYCVCQKWGQWQDSQAKYSLHLGDGAAGPTWSFTVCGP